MLIEYVTFTNYNNTIKFIFQLNKAKWALYIGNSPITWEFEGANK